MNDNTVFLRNLLLQTQNIYSWTFTPNMDLLESNCPNELIFHILFSTGPRKELENVVLSTQTLPLVLHDSFGLVWLLAFERSGSDTLEKIHMIGPAFYDDIAHNALERMINGLNLSILVRQDCMDCLNDLPIIPGMRFLEYGQMLHYALTGDVVTASRFSSLSREKKKRPVPDTGKKHQGTWQVEQTLMKMVEEGNLDYQKRFDTLGANVTIGTMSYGEPLRQMKNENIVLITLCTRAAIRGGLVPETAYTLSDKYIQQTESCTSVEDLREMYLTMMDDFIYRVHEAKNAVGISAPIRQCRDYINFHITENLDVATLAKEVGYAENYLSKKFKAETGENLTTYILKAKIGYAKQLLMSKEMSILEVSDILGFHSQSYFGKQFKRFTGETPGDFLDRAGTTFPHKGD